MTQERYKLQDIVDFIENHKKDTLAFRGWTSLQIAQAVIKTHEEGTLLYSVDADEKINGVVLGILSGDKFHIVNMLTIKPGVTKQLGQVFREMFPKCHTLTYYRGDKFKEHSVEMLQRFKD